ncbi:hypothetical protein NIES2101_10915 [Calothrix sp. HK-06]|nr:hypothetical protein NIES2101_10915 [Calothrix sp. HK-06]
MKQQHNIVIIGTSLCLVSGMIFLSSQFAAFNILSLSSSFRLESNLATVSSFNVNCLTNQRSPFLKVVDLMLRVVIISFLGVGTLSYSPRFERYFEVIPKNYKFISLVTITLISLLIMDSVFVSSTRISHNCP